MNEERTAGTSGTTHVIPGGDITAGSGAAEGNGEAVARPVAIAEVDPHFPLAPELEPQDAIVPITMMTLLDRALQNHAAIDVIERLAALQEKAMHRQDEIDFNTAMNAAQAEIGRVAPDLKNSQTN